MKTPCELVVSKILPSLRASVVKELSGKHGMKQSEIAKKLGITQASVSQYLSATRAGDPGLVEKFPKILEYAKDISPLTRLLVTVMYRETHLPFGPEILGDDSPVDK